MNWNAGRRKEMLEEHFGWFPGAYQYHSVDRCMPFILENMLTLSKLGVRNIPAKPAFYNRPSSLDEMIDFMVGKVLDSMDIEHSLYKRWGESHEQPRQ